MAVFLNQFGYHSSDMKVAHATGGERAFRIVNALDETVLAGTFEPSRLDKDSGDMVAEANFSSVYEDGAYRLIVDGQSLPFIVGTNVYDAVGDALCKAFYYFRCGCALEPEFAGVFAHPICHTHAVMHDTGKEIDVTGGWHDAGDYGRYPAPAGKAVADLLFAFHLNPAVFSRELHIPESHLTMPDILSEVRYELEYFFKMQREDGAVYHKSTTRRFSGFIMPQDDTVDTVVLPISTVATGDIAAVMAMAASIYRPYDAAFSERCRNSALLAYGFLQANPEAILPPQNPPDVSTGAYGDFSDRDERFCAAAAMYRLTGAPEYLADTERYYREMMAEFAPDGIAQAQNDHVGPLSLGWKCVGGYGVISCLLNPQLDPSLPFVQELRSIFKNKANELVELAKNSCYHTAIRSCDYIWGSNMLLMNNAVHLLLAYRMYGEQAYYDTAMAQWHYLLGDNPNGYCYITGLGTKPALHPHYRPSGADGVDAPVPGMVVGGPNQNLQDQYAARLCAELAPAKCYLDLEESYSTNEVAIYWNSIAILAWALLC